MGLYLELRTSQGLLKLSVGVKVSFCFVSSLIVMAAFLLVALAYLRGLHQTWAELYVVLWLGFFGVVVLRSPEEALAGRLPGILVVEVLGH